MKKTVFLPLMFAVVMLSSCMKNPTNENVPAPVILAFESKFPDMENVVWNMTDKGGWEAKFSVYHQGYSAVFDPKGNWIETDHKIIKSAVPLNVKLALHDNYNEYEIEDVFVAERRSGKFCEMAIMTHGHEIDVEANFDGQLTGEREHQR